jgi:hypothetical protein
MLRLGELRHPLSVDAFCQRSILRRREHGGPFSDRFPFAVTLKAQVKVFGVWALKDSHIVVQDRTDKWLDVLIGINP